MCVPVILFWQGLVNAVVEIFVMREDDVPANIVELSRCQCDVRVEIRAHWVGEITNPSGVISVEAKPPGVSLESMIIHDGPSYTLSEHSFVFG